MNRGAEEEFTSRLPGLMTWLNDLRQQRRLRGCGGWLDAKGALTLIEADSIEEAGAIDRLNPLNEIGSTEILAWEVFYADLVVQGQF